jgi:hypothetical protein
MSNEDRTPARGEPRLTGPRPLGPIADLADLLAGETPSSRTFITGLIAGALVGAAVAGGSWIRRRGRRAGGR